MGMIHLHMATARFYTTGQILEPAASLVQGRASLTVNLSGWVLCTKKVTQTA